MQGLLIFQHLLSPKERNSKLSWVFIQKDTDRYRYLLYYTVIPVTEDFLKWSNKHIPGNDMKGVTKLFVSKVLTKISDRSWIRSR